MRTDVLLRAVRKGDLPIFFEQQLDPEATRMAAFPARARSEFMAHWEKSLTDETVILRTIVYREQVAGNVVFWEPAGEPKVGFWLGREYWGKGIASAALAQFLGCVKIRPLYARVAKTNGASIRVLQKCGFEACGEDVFHGPDGEPGSELIMSLGARAAG